MDNNSKQNWKVGVFVFIGIVLIGALMFSFSKGTNLFTPTYDVHLLMPTVAGLRPKADVMMQGIPVGKVLTTELGPEGTNVIIHLRILSKFKIHANSEFHVDALGFLGDQYIEVTPTLNEGGFLTNGATVYGEAPFDLQQAVRSTAGLLEQASRTLKNLDLAITNINQTILSQKTLTNFGNAIINFQDVSEAAARMSLQFEGLLNSNTAPVSSTVSNLQSASRKLDVLADDISATFATNRGDLTGSIHDFRQTAANFRQISEDLQAGKGVAGGMLKDEVMKAQAQAAITNLNQLAISLHEFSVKLNEKGLWSVLWKSKNPPSKSNPAP